MNYKRLIMIKNKGTVCLMIKHEEPFVRSRLQDF